MEATPVFSRIEMPSPLETLQARLLGKVVLPGDADYDKARMAWNLTVDQHPAIIVVASSPLDVVEAVRYARKEDLKIAIQSTGHGVVRPANGSLLLVTSKLKSVRVDAARQTVWVQAGVQWGDVLAPAQAVGLAPLLGSSLDVGVVGYTLGGGMGWLARKYGMAADSVNFFDLVTADGQMVRASRTENADLFWGLRGGGGNFGIVVGMEMRLYPVTTVYAGNLIYPIEQAREVFAHYCEWIKTAPDELTSSIAIMNFPPLPELPPFLQGRTVIIVRGCSCGTIEEGETLLKHWRTWQAPMVDDWKAMPFSQAGLISNEPVDPVPGKSSGAWMGELNEAAFEVIMRFAVPTNGPIPLIIAEVRHAGGAIARVESGSNAYSHREALHNLQMVGFAPSPEALAGLTAHIAEFKRALQPYLTGGVYLNFLEGDESRARTKDGFSPEAYRRLQAVKARYDADNRFSHSFDIAPVAGFTASES